jgi:protocatechuate 3,4-dioxygenase beta subunit
MPKLNPHGRRPAPLVLVFTAALLLTIALPLPALAQKEAPATVSGRVADGERGAQGVTVMLVSSDPSQRSRPAARAKTDAEGRFLLTNVAPGRYQILPVAPAYVVAGLGMSYPPGRPLTLLAGDEVKDIDFQMEAGGVITGRVTDADGNPVIAEQVLVSPVEDAAGQQPRFDFDQRDQQTDDRGVYRIYGLPPGRYRVAVGRGGDAGAVSFGRRKIFRRTFYPDATDQAQARVVEVKSGIEATDVDITVGRALKTYKVAGRFVTADAGQPVAGIPVGFNTLDARGRRTGGYGGITTTNARGEFVADGLAPGRYAVYSTNNNFQQQEATEFYSDPVNFEVADSDVSGLLVKLKRGATVSGVITIEGVSDRAAAAQMLSAVRVYPRVEVNRQAQQATAGPMRLVNVNADGTFRVIGLVPGKLRLGTMNDAVKGLTTARVELNGANVTGGFDLAEGAQVTGVHVVMTYGTATVVGQTTYVNGAVPPGARVMAFARLVGPTPGNTPSHSAEVDARGFFRLEGLPAGEYEVTVNVFAFSAGRTSRSAPVRVVVGDGGEARVAPVMDFQADPRQPNPGREP